MSAPRAARDLPRNIDGITPEWLAAALSETFLGLRVDMVEVVDVVHGACTKVRLAVKTDRNDFPPTMMMKAGFEPHSTAMQMMHHNEYRAYHDIIPTLGVNAPMCHYAGLAPDGRALVVLEDLCLRGVSFQSLQAPLGFDLAAGYLELLAKMHARWWQSPELQSGGRFGEVPRLGSRHMRHYLDMLDDPTTFASYINAPRGAAMPRKLLDADLIRRAHQRMGEHFATMPETINHGDMHLGNLYTDADGSPGLLDFQPCVGPWSIDVGYFLIAGLDLVDRRRWQSALLQHYLTCLAGHGIAAPSFDEAWLAYRRSVVWGLLIWLLNGSHFQTEANNTAAATRFAMAMIDLETLHALGLEHA